MQLTAPNAAVATGSTPELALVGNDSATGMASLIADRSLATQATVTTGATEPRAAATSTGTWVTYAKSGMAEPSSSTPPAHRRRR